MKQLWLVLMLLPVVGLAQVSFDPVRIDDGQGEQFYYPLMEWDGANLMCAWSSTSETEIVTSGRLVSPWGNLLGEITYQDIQQGGEIWCPANLTLLHSPDGSDPYLVFHS